MRESNPCGPSDLRRHQRRSAAGRVLLSWTDGKGVDCVARGECRNVSESGVAVEVRDRLTAQTYVSLQCPPQGIRGSGSIRYCVRKNLAWVVGIEFSGGLSWRPGAARP